MQIKKFLNLIRWPNLIIIALSMIFTRWYIIIPLSGAGGMNMVQFLILMFSVLSITIAGYIINDFFDMDADRINKPGKNLIGTTFSVAWAKNAYYLFSALGIVGGLLLSWWINEINYTLIFLLTTGILWYYSERYQCQVLLGNMVVALLSALSFGLVWLYEFFAMRGNAALFSSAQPNFRLISYLVLIYMGFAFLSSLFREIVKDIEDGEGDSRMGCRTLPVVVGTAKTKTYAIIVGLLILVFILYVQYFMFLSGFFMVFGYFFVVDTLLLLVLIKLNKAKDIVDFSNLSGLIKLFMVTGILSMILFYFEH